MIYTDLVRVEESEARQKSRVQWLEFYFFLGKFSHKIKTENWPIYKFTRGIPQEVTTHTNTKNTAKKQEFTKPKQNTY